MGRRKARILPKILRLRRCVEIARGVSGIKSGRKRRHIRILKQHLHFGKRTTRWLIYYTVSTLTQAFVTTYAQLTGLWPFYADEAERKLHKLMRVSQYCSVVASEKHTRKLMITLFA